MHTQYLLFMIQKNIVLSDDYGGIKSFIAEKLGEPITIQYLETYPSNTTCHYLSLRIQSECGKIRTIKTTYKCHEHQLSPKR